MDATSYREREENIQHILQTAKTIAVVGLHSDSSRPANYVPAYLQSKGYRIIPVNPYETEVLGEKAYKQLADIPEPVDLVLIFRRSEHVPPFVQQAVEIGAAAVWMQSGIINEAAAQVAREAGLRVVMDACMKIEHQRSRR